jgi:hypothetical protein
MKFELPFSVETINNMVGKTMVLSDQHKNESSFRPFMILKVKGGGEFDGGYFEVVDGILRIIDNQGLFCEFEGLETKGQSVYAVGVAAQVEHRHGFERVTMHEYKSLVDSFKFGICISSYVEYADITLPILLESIRKAGFDMSAVVAVVGGFKGEKVETIEGATVFYCESNGRGFGGLSKINDNYPYWLMLHDTCEADRNFNDLVGGIDVGLNPDVIRLRTDMNDWTGFYKMTFVQKVSEEIGRKPEWAKTIITSTAKIVTSVQGIVVESVTKDVYGRGHKRVMDKLPIGIRKYRNQPNSRGL